MTVVGHGIDIIEIPRFKRILDGQQQKFETQYFTVMECEIADRAGVNRVQCLAGRFAGKEAVLKALGTGWSHGIKWTDVEIGKLPTGGPFVILYEQAAIIADQLGITEWMISISHQESYAVASVIALRP